MEWQYGVLTPDDGRTIVYGQWQDGVRWNGWLCPRFTFDVAVGIVASIATHEDDVMSYAVRGRDIVVTEHDVGSVDSEETYETVYSPDGDGMYAVGSWAWCWQAHEPD